jgi:hypothetical protein
MASKSKRNKVKFKWTKELGFLLGSIAIIGVAAILLAIPTRAERKLEKINDSITEYNSANETSYYTLPKDHVFKEISHSSLVSKKKSSNYTIVWYGSLKNGTYLQYLYTLNTMADTYDVNSIYLYYASFVEDAQADEETETEAYKTQLKAREDALNDNKASDATEIDLENYPAIFVFKDGQLLFNSQVGTDSTEYNWEIYFNAAFGLTK